MSDHFSNAACKCAIGSVHISGCSRLRANIANKIVIFICKSAKNSATYVTVVIAVVVCTYAESFTADVTVVITVVVCASAENRSAEVTVVIAVVICTNTENRSAKIAVVIAVAVCAYAESYTAKVAIVIAVVICASAESYAAKVAVVIAVVICTHICAADVAETITVAIYANGESFPTNITVMIAVVVNAGCAVACIEGNIVVEEYAAVLVYACSNGECAEICGIDSCKALSINKCKLFCTAFTEEGKYSVVCNNYLYAIPGIGIVYSLLTGCRCCGGSGGYGEVRGGGTGSNNVIRIKRIVSHCRTAVVKSCKLVCI